ncbi:uncharacterized protein LOC111395848 [Olea europaea var. sylvestris]|uniref:uncharacterized protein LOC111395848 n=1 Tax=Olea europaea var. sylvestris TaxID=158386 RepID=UPI000C1D15CD|nr:uncharacterized protein LOC111395848 [Olea europaea var. sylvestris]XP_022877806.1 uncharacterized protein LOC111395848 [Olea europaea var. sylvestris]
MSLTRGGNTSSRARQRKPTRGGGTRSIRSNNEHHDPSTLNDELGGEHPDDLPIASHRTKGHNCGIPMHADRLQRIEIIIKNSTFGETFIPCDITAIMKAYFDCPYPTFCLMPQPIRDGLWDRFMVLHRLSWG